MGGVILPPAAWRERPGLARLIAALGPGTARIVGGAVRDTLLGQDTADIDLATTHDPQAVIALLEAARIKAVPTGIKHGTITAVANDEVYEVTTLRRDVETDGRHATVAFTDDWREDAARRDFTINALYADPATGAVFDYFGGLGDLERRHIRFIGDPLVRIAEDHLRILRFFRFLARFGDSPDPVGLAACTARANDLMALSRERIANELLRLLVAPRAVEVVALMLAHGILTPVLPEIVDTSLLARVVELEEAAELPPDPIRRLAALMSRNAKAAEDVGSRLKLSNAQRKQLSSAMIPSFGSPHELAYRFGRQAATDRWLLTIEENFDAVIGARHLQNMKIPVFPLTGGQLVARGITAGPDVARTLRAIEDRWIAEGFPDAVRVGVIADDAVAQTLAAIRKA
ncbi:MAG: CCA tRNA nucleotidyltransferase [Sphingomonas sp.]|uniref:CCA tRNA nucleotidyltransferase n=1 Tax=Sphingomonas sp. TaxID=28214 RepID=UPI001AC6826C|nr:CCA tRNA nucleotidyltransferase [Sphingomonas sp.]MBN8807784.1 CCA tRNA nucleotidyltransferase [Sphingomonas sp.]